MADERPPIESFLKSPIQPEDLESKTEEIDIKVIRGKKGDKGDKPSSEELLALIEPLIPKPIKGDAGKSVEVDDLIPLIQDLMPNAIKPSMEDIEAIVLTLLPEPVELPELAPKDLIEKINKAKTAKIKRERVEGLYELEGLAKSANRNVQNFISLGGNRQTKLQLNGVQVATGADTLNFIGGTLTPIGDGTTVNYTPPSTGSGGSSAYQQPTGIVNGTNTAFTFLEAPTVISVDQGRVMQRVSSDGTVNWTGTTSIVLAVAPTFDIYGISTVLTGYQSPTGTVNGTNAVFTFATAPSVITVDQGRAMQKVSSDGTVNWTGTLVVTLSVAPNYDIFGIA